MKIHRIKRDKTDAHQRTIERQLLPPMILESEIDTDHPKIIYSTLLWNARLWPFFSLIGHTKLWWIGLWWLLFGSWNDWKTRRRRNRSDKWAVRNRIQQSEQISCIRSDAKIKSSYSSTNVLRFSFSSTELLNVHLKIIIVNAAAFKST